MCDGVAKVYLSRRNLLTLLSKLDRVKEGQESACTIMKCDDAHPKYPQNVHTVWVQAVEDEDYYVDRPAGKIFPADEERIKNVR